MKALIGRSNHDLFQIFREYELSAVLVINIVQGTHISTVSVKIGKGYTIQFTAYFAKFVERVRGTRSLYGLVASFGRSLHGLVARFRGLTFTGGRITTRTIWTTRHLYRI